MLRSGTAILFKSTNWLPQLTARLYSSNITPIPMAFDVFGEAHADKNEPPLIIMHGLLGSKQNWRSMSRALEPKIKRTIFAVDARNHGDSPHTDVHDSEHMAEDIKAFMAAKNISKACVVGHSMGGRTMMYFALKYPQLVERTIILDISPNELPPDFSYTEDVIRAMTKVQIPAKANLVEGRALAEKQMKESLDYDGDITFALMNLKKKPTGEFYWTANVDVLLQRVSFLRNFMEKVENFPPFSGPALLIYGTESEFVSEADVPAFKKLFPTADIKTLKAGHLLHIDQPQQFMEIIVEFLKK